MLWRGRKFHFRVYALLRADMSAWLYRTAYILSASRPYSLRRKNGDERAGAAAEGNGVRREGFPDELVHISNLAVNKHTEGHPGQASYDRPQRAACCLNLYSVLGVPCCSRTPTSTLNLESYPL